jgi:hypothetical protein
MAIIGRMVINMRYLLVLLMASLLPTTAWAGSPLMSMMGMWSAGGGATLLSVSENFDDYTNLASIDTLHGWVHPNAPDGTYADARSVSDKVVGTSSRKSIAYWGDDTFAADQKTCMTVKTAGTGGPAVRIGSGTGYSGYWVSASGGNHILVKGSDTVLATYGTQTVDDVVCISATGTSTTVLTVSINGTPQTTYNDSSTPFTSGQPGLRADGNVFYGDNWTAEEI